MTAFRSIFARSRTTVEAPPLATPLMRVLEPRILLDAAATETASEIAGQAAHDEMASEFAASLRAVAAPDGDEGREAIAEMVLTDANARRTDREVVFIDAGIENRDALIASLEDGVSVHVLDANRDGIAQIADVLSASGGYEAVHIFSHGTAGALALGSGTLDEASMQGRHGADLARIGAALSAGGDILVYGCDFGQGEEGLSAARALAAATGADIAASDDLTGAESLSGDWNLEVSVGEVATAAYSLPDWRGVLGDAVVRAEAQPLIGHATGGFVGTAGTYAIWENAVIVDEGLPSEATYDLRATLQGLSENTSAFFETVSTTDPTMDDVRVVVTNLNPVTGQVAGEDVREPGIASVLWEIYVSGTETLAPPEAFNLTLTGIEGLGGQVDTRESVSIDPFDVWNFTTEAASELAVTATAEAITGTGTQTGTGTSAAALSAYWASANQFAIAYTSYTQTTGFVMDGDGDVTFANPVTTVTQDLDLNGAGAGRDHTVTYFDGSIAGSNLDVGVPVVSADAFLYDLTDSHLEAVTIELTNGSPGDALVFDQNLMDELGLFADLTDNGTTITLELSGYALISSFETALKSVRYANADAAPVVTPRIITVAMDDGVVQTEGPQTTVVWATAGTDPVTAPNVYVELEDTTLAVSAAQGLLSDDSDPQNDPFLITQAFDSNGDAITLGIGYVTPQNALLTLNADGSFTYVPDTHYSGAETITYAVAGGPVTATGFAVFDIQPVLDTLTVTTTQPQPASDEDVISGPLQIAVSSPDPSETQTIEARDIPAGVILTDGVEAFRATQNATSVDISDWDLNNIRVRPNENSDVDVHITVRVFNQEIDESDAFQNIAVIFQVDAVADQAILVIEEAGGAIDGDVELFRPIDVQLFDTDGSETLTGLRFENLPSGTQMLIAGVPQTIVAGVVTVPATALPDLVFRPPQTGADASYVVDVIAITQETADENGISVLVAETAPVQLRIELNNNDDPVFPEDDYAQVFAGESVTIDVLENDYVPDGSPVVTEVNGQLVLTGQPVVLPGGQGSVDLDNLGRLVFEAAPDFSGTVVFTYTVEDVDGSRATANVFANVLPRWEVISDATAVEGAAASHGVRLSGNVQQGLTASVDVALTDVDTTAGDRSDLVTAIQNAVAAAPDAGFSFDGTTISYTAPDTAYDAIYDATGSAFLDISATGNTLNLGDDGIAAVPFGFDFPLFGDVFAAMFVSANGYVTFASPLDVPNNATLDGTAFGGRPAIAAYWDDLDSSTGGVFSEIIGVDPGSRQFIVQWTDMTVASDPGGTITFQMVFDEATGDVRIHYADTVFGGVSDDGATAVIGMEGRGGLGAEYAFRTAGSVVSGSSLLLQRTFLDNPTLTFQIDIVDDPLFEPQEAYEIELSNASGAGLGTSLTTTVIDASDNLAPVAVDDAMATIEDDPVTVNVLTDPVTGDSDPEGHAITVTRIDGATFTSGDTITLASGAQVTVESGGSITFFANGVYDFLSAGEQRTETIVYTVTDVYGAEDTATLTVTIDGRNTPPVVDLNDDGTTPGTGFAVDYPPTAAAIGVTAPDATLIEVETATVDYLTIELAGFVQTGDERITLGAGATPLTILYGTAITGTATAGGTTFDVAYNDVTDTITITGPGLAPFPVVDGTALLRTITYENVSADDTPGFRTLRFVADDGLLVGPESVATIRVLGNNTPPDAVDDGPGAGFDTVEETPVTIAKATLMLNDSDADGDAIDIIAAVGLVGGTAALDGAGDVVFTPDPDFEGQASFQYTLQDARGGQSTATVTLNVAGVNDAPVIDLNGIDPGNDFAVAYAEDGPAVAIAHPAHTLTDVDSTDLTGLTVRLDNGQAGDVLNVDAGSMPAGIGFFINPPSGGTGLPSAQPVTITFSGTASLADYRAALCAVRFESISEDPDGTDRTITVTATDGITASNPATTTISVTAVNDDPTAGDDGPLDVDEDTFLDIPLTLILANDADVDGGTVQFVAVTGAVNGTAVQQPGGEIRFTPTADYFGPASFDYEIADGQGGTAFGTVNLNVVAVNDAPTLMLDVGGGGSDYAGSYTEDGASAPLTGLAVAIADIDSNSFAGATVTLTNGQPGDAIDVSAVPLPVTASTVPADPLTGAGTIVVTLQNAGTAAEYEAALAALRYSTVSDDPDATNRVFEVTVSDGTDPSNTATATIAVTPVNDAPVAVTDDLSVAEDTELRLAPAALTGNDTDPDSPTPVLVSVADGTGGTVAIDGLSGEIVFTPTPDFSGAATFTYVIEDDGGLTSTGTVNVTVTPVDDAPLLDLTAAAGADYATAYTEGDAPVDLTQGASVADIDSPALERLEVTITNGKAGDILTTGTLPPGITAGFSTTVPLLTDGPLTMTLTGPATLADWDAALALVRYASSSGNPSEEVRSIAFTAFDATGPSNVATATVSVTRVNSAPDAVADGPFATDEDQALALNTASLLFNDSDADGDLPYLVSVQGEMNGTVALSGSTITFTPTPDFFGTASFDYTIEDGNGASDTATVTIQVQPINDAPTLDLDGTVPGTGYAVTWTEGGGAIAIADASIVADDVDTASMERATITLANGRTGDSLALGVLPPGISGSISPPGPLPADVPQTITLVGTGAPSVWAAAIGSITFDNGLGNPFQAPRTIDVVLFDDESLPSLTATATIAISAVNDAPVAQDDGVFATDEDTPLNLAAASLTFNDFDPEGDTFTIVSVGGEVGGVAVLSGTQITFTPDADTSGPASFEYTVQDAFGAQATARVDIAVTPVNDAPTLDLDTTAGATGTGFLTAWSEGDAPVVLADPTLLIEDVDDTDLTSATIVLTNGDAGDELVLPGLPAGFTAIVSPAGPLLVAGTQTVTVTAAGGRPIADWQSILGGVAYHSVSEDPDGSDRIILLRVSDGSAASDDAVARVAVTPVNDAPVAAPDGPFGAVEDTPYDVQTTALTFNDADPEGEALTVTSVQNASGGTVALSGTTVTFTPDDDYNGPASFEYTVADATGATTDATVTLDVAAVNDAPTLDLDPGTAGNGNAVSYIENDPPVALADPSLVLADVDDATLQAITVTMADARQGDVLALLAPVPGITFAADVTLPLAADGPVTVTLSGPAPVADFATALAALTFESTTDALTSGSRSVAFVVDDGETPSAPAVVTITVTGVNDTPTPADDTGLTVDEDTALLLTDAALLANDSDPDGEPLTVTGVQNPVNGTVVRNAAGEITFTPDPGYAGPASFEYVVEDAGGLSQTASVTITVTAINDAPEVDLDAGTSGIDYATSYTENGPGVPVADASVTVYDDDDALLPGITVVLTDGIVGDLLEVGALPGTIGATVLPAGPLTADGTVTVSLAGPATAADFAVALRAVAYRSATDALPSGTRTIEVTASDGDLDSIVARTIVTVTGVNDDPVAAADGAPLPLTLDEDTPFTFDPIANDTDADNDVLTIVAIGPVTVSPGDTVAVTNGQVFLAADGRTLTFTPAANYSGPVAFDYTITDGTTFDSAIVDLAVLPVNDAPDAVDDGPVTLDEDTFVFFDPVTPNDTDVEGSALDVVSIEGQSIVPGGTVTVAQGTVSLGADGRTLNFVPTADFHGTAVVRYGVSDGADTGEADITFVVAPQDDPLAVASTPADRSAADGEAVNWPMAQHIDDPDDDALLFTLSGAPSGLTIDATSGVISGVVGADASLGSPYTLTVTASDGINPVVDVQFTLDVTNPVPVAGPVTSVLLDEGGAFSLALTDFVTDPDGDALSFLVSGLPAWATFDGVATVSGTVPSDGALFGAVALAVTADDGQGGVTPFTLDLVPVNADPVATRTLADVATVAGETEIEISLAALFTDPGPDDDVLTITVSGLPTGVTFDAGAQTIAGTPAPSAARAAPYTVTVRADDGQGAPAAVTFDLRVEAPAAPTAPTATAPNGVPGTVVPGTGDNLFLPASAEPGTDEPRKERVVGTDVFTGGVLAAFVGESIDPNAPRALVGGAGEAQIAGTVAGIGRDGLGAGLSQQIRIGLERSLALLSLEGLRALTPGGGDRDPASVLTQEERLALLRAFEAPQTGRPSEHAWVRSLRELIERHVGSPATVDYLRSLGRDRAALTGLDWALLERPRDPRLDRIGLGIEVIDGKLYLSLRNELDALDANAVRGVGIEPADGGELPEALRDAGGGRVGVDADAAGERLRLVLSVTLADGTVLTKPVEVRVPQAPAEPAPRPTALRGT